MILLSKYIEFIELHRITLRKIKHFFSIFWTNMILLFNKNDKNKIKLNIKNLKNNVHMIVNSHDPKILCIKSLFVRK